MEIGWLLRGSLAAVVASVLLAQEAPRKIEIDATLAQVGAHVTDSRGNAVLNLTREDFEIYEDGVPQTITYFEATNTPLSVLTLVDDAVADFRNRWVIERTIPALAESLRAGDETASALFGHGTSHTSFISTIADWQVIDGTQQPLRLDLSAIDRSGSGRRDIPLYSAIGWGLDKLASRAGRKAVVLLTSGLAGYDLNFRVRRESLPEGSYQRIVDPKDDQEFQRLLRDVRSSGVRFYMVATDTDLNPGMAHSWTSRGHLPMIINAQEIRARLLLMAELSGGRVEYPTTMEDVLPMFPRLASELGTSYSLGYTPKLKRDGAYRSIRVTVRGPGYTLRQTRDGYVDYR